MAYDVSLKTAAFDVANKDLVFNVKQDGSVLGHLLISKAASSGCLKTTRKDTE